MITVSAHEIYASHVQLRTCLKWTKDTPGIDCLWLDPVAGVMFGTDGRRLVLFGAATPCGVEPDRCVPLRREHIDMLAGRRGTQTLRWVGCEGRWHHLQLGGTDIGPLPSFGSDLDEPSRPPDIRIVWPKGGQTIHNEEFGLNPNYLADVRDFARVTGAACVRVRLGPTPLDPIELLADGDGLAAMLLMPVRLR